MLVERNVICCIIVVTKNYFSSARICSPSKLLLSVENASPANIALTLSSKLHFKCVYIALSYEVMHLAIFFATILNLTSQGPQGSDLIVLHI